MKYYYIDINALKTISYLNMALYDHYIYVCKQSYYIISNKTFVKCLKTIFNNKIKDINNNITIE